MTKDKKIEIVEELSGQLSSSSCFYIADASGLSVADTNSFRKKCFDKGIEYRVVKNTLIKKALDKLEGKINNLDDFNRDVLKGFSGIMILDNICNTPAKILKEFRKEKGGETPLLKGAFVDGDIFVGDQFLDELARLKSKEELIGDVISLLQSPIKNLLSSLDSGKNNISGVLKALSNKDENTEK